MLKGGKVVGVISDRDINFVLQFKDVDPMKIASYKKDFLGLVAIIIFVGTILVIILGGMPIFAQNSSADDVKGIKNQWRREGKLFTLVVSKDNPIRIFVEGREEVKIDLSKFKITVRMMDPYPGKVLKLSQIDDYFVVADPVKFKKATELEIKTHFKDKDETFHVELKQSLP